MFVGRGDHSGKLGHLHWRIRLFAIGAGLAIGGIAFDSSWLIYAAILVLVAGMALRFAPETDTGADVGSEAESDAGAGSVRPD